MPIAPAGTAPSGFPMFGAPARIAADLRASGWDGCSTASNHSLDRGTDGVTTSCIDGRNQAGFVISPAGSFVIRMDQPYSRAIDMLLDIQYYNPDDPSPYDDVGWTLGPLFNAQVDRV